MKKRVLLGMFVVVCLLGSAALALDPMGPPKSLLKQGESSFGLEGSYSDMDIHRMRTNWSDAKKVATLDEMWKVYANMGLGVSDTWDVFVRAGVLLDADYSRRSDWTKWSGDGDADFALGVGARTTLAQVSPELSIGALAQYSWTSFDGSLKSADGDRGSFDVDMGEIQIAAGPTWTVGEGVSVYGGPFYHFIDGTIEEARDGDRMPKSIEEESSFGGFVGLAVQLASNTCMTAEYMTTSDSWAAAVGFMFRQ